MTLVDPEDLISATDAAKLIGVTAAAISNYLARRTNGFPQPVAVVANGRTPLFLRSQVIAWWTAKHPEMAAALRDTS